MDQALLRTEIFGAMVQRIVNGMTPDRAFLATCVHYSLDEECAAFLAGTLVAFMNLACTHAYQVNAQEGAGN